MFHNNIVVVYLTSAYVACMKVRFSSCLSVHRKGGGVGGNHVSSNPVLVLSREYPLSFPWSYLEGGARRPSSVLVLPGGRLTLILSGTP